MRRSRPRLADSYGGRREPKSLARDASKSTLEGEDEISGSIVSFPPVRRARWVLTCPTAPHLAGGGPRHGAQNPFAKKSWHGDIVRPAQPSASPPSHAARFA